MTSLAPRFARYQALTLVQHGPILEIVMGAAQSANRKLSTADAGLHRELAEIWRDVSAFALGDQVEDHHTLGAGFQQGRHRVRAG